MGATIGVTLNIYEFSTPADKQILVRHTRRARTRDSSNALQRMKAVGHVEITGTLGNDCSYIKMIPTPTGRKIVFLTNRQIRFGEAYYDTQSSPSILPRASSKSTTRTRARAQGVMYPAAQLVLDKQGELQWDLRENAWKLV